jgi:hypothetical protein
MHICIYICMYVHIYIYIHNEIGGSLSSPSSRKNDANDTSPNVEDARHNYEINKFLNPSDREINGVNVTPPKDIQGSSNEIENKKSRLSSKNIKGANSPSKGLQVNVLRSSPSSSFCQKNNGDVDDDITISSPSYNDYDIKTGNRIYKSPSSSPYKENNDDNITISSSFSSFWNANDHAIFTKTFRRVQLNGTLRKDFIGTLRSHLPYKSVEDILVHEDWYRRLRSIINSQKECTNAYELSRSELIIKAKEGMLVYIYIRMYTSIHMNMYMSIYIYIHIHTCIYIHIFICIYKYIYI